jgi:hypothetical protein
MNDRTALMARCRMIATRTLVAAHKDEFRGLLADEYAANGIEVNMRNTGREAKIERLKAQIAALEAAAE